MPVGTPLGDRSWLRYSRAREASARSAILTMPATKPGATSLAAQAQERRGRHGTSPSIRSSPWIQSIGYRAPESGPVENGANWSRTASPAERKTRRAALPKPHRLRRGLDTCVQQYKPRAHMSAKPAISSSPNSTPACTPSARPPRLTSSTGSPPRTWRGVLVGTCSFRTG